MVSDADFGVVALDDTECWQLLGRSGLGRLAVAVLGEPDIFPVNYILVDHGIIFRTAQGTKLASLTVDSRVAFEIDGVDERSGTAWSVVAHGTAEVLDADDIPGTGGRQVTSWHRAPKPLIVRISVDSLTGRRFVAD
jgi:hypothetical protein